MRRHKTLRTQEQPNPIELPPELLQEIENYAVEEMAPVAPVVLLNGEITKDSATRFIFDCLDVVVQNPDKPLVVGINSGGGCYHSSMMIVDFIKSLPVQTVSYNMSIAMSGACLVFMACDKRYAFKHSKFMLHNVYTTGATGTTSEIATELKNMQSINSEMAKFIVKNCKVNKRALNKKFKELKDWTFDAPEAVTIGVATKVNSNLAGLLLKGKV